MIQSILLSLAILAALYGILWLAAPKGNLLHELLHLPPFWLHILWPQKDFREEKIVYGSHRRQYMMLCMPPSGVPLKPFVLFYFHGGGWQFGAPEQFRAHAQQLTGLGYVVLLPSYRRIPRYQYKHLREDLTQLLLKAREVLREKGLPEKGAIIGGMSAGGNMAALAALNRQELEKAGINPEWFKGLFLLGAPLHLARMANTFSLRSFAGPRKEPMFRQASPYHYLDEPVAIRTLIIHGSRDGMVEYPGTQEFAEKLRAVNLEKTTFVPLPEGTHLDVASWFFREGRARKALLEWLEGFSR
ncbi:MAG: alpha/beta hydrolase [Lewinellaceae bacterium]|nr:alpha/beta hydrolase [Lewinellaceae bacterium]